MVLAPRPWKLFTSWEMLRLTVAPSRCLNDLRLLPILWSLRGEALALTARPSQEFRRSCFYSPMSLKRIRNGWILGMTEGFRHSCRPVPPMRQQDRVLSKQIFEQLFPVTAEYLELDRKSTRLNSSHMSISYAVFCLK